MVLDAAVVAAAVAAADQDTDCGFVLVGVAVRVAVDVAVEAGVVDSFHGRDRHSLIDGRDDDDRDDHDHDDDGDLEGGCGQAVDAEVEEGVAAVGTTAVEATAAVGAPVVAVADCGQRDGDDDLLEEADAGADPRPGPCRRWGRYPYHPPCRHPARSWVEPRQHDARNLARSLPRTAGSAHRARAARQPALQSHRSPRTRPCPSAKTP